ncbi:transcriptional regulator [Candidatus Scalindua japonica]|uniref:Transcriptional regulator n=1 Tax=Candidatus Scalindua japonica TaxID=1284222 RepID=A0A286TW16_9BACT|nr:sigma 54-interacting transcriptional regulator [Candidatus Scalindua japonica]GAX60096.1 transcriptional regulator [Candidatus Scalindua japonica]
MQKQKKVSGLRKEAEKRLKPDIIPIAKLSEAEVRKLAHELQVHQIELEMQNEELRKAQLLIEESRRKYLDLFDFAPLGYFTIDETGLILESNLTGAAMLGIERSLLINKPIAKFIYSEDQDKYYLYIRTVYDGEKANACELKMVKKDGTVFHVQLECSVVHDAGDNVRQCRTLLTDISKRKQSEIRLSAQHAITRILAESITLEEASSKILQPICEALEWDYGEIWTYDQQQRILRNTETWHIPSSKFSEFKDVTKQITFPPKIGLPGRVRESAEPLWIADVVHDSDFLRASVADKVGLHGAFGFPIIIGSEVLGTICFFNREIRKPNKGLLNMMAAIGRQVGLFIKHKLADNDIQRFKENLEAIFKTIRDGIILLDRELKIVEFNQSARRICGLPDINKARGEKFELLHKSCKGECVATLKETTETKLPAEKIRFECFNAMMSRVLVSVTTYPLLDSNKQFNGCVIVVRDETQLAVLESSLQDRRQFHNIIGKSADIQKVFSLIETLADIPTTVLITGESGTGKRLVAEALHYHGKDSGEKPFVVVSCSSLSDNLLESELFGHVKGSFTGAISDRVGRFEKAEGGTIFLDEIGDISSTMQLRLLRVLEERVFERVGDSKTIKSNVRIIAATNRDLRINVSKGKFREDLYHRLKIVELALPPLRDRREDIPLLVEHFIEKLNLRLNKHVESLSAEVQKIFMNYTWKGNIRELNNTMEYAFITCGNTVITLDNLPSEFNSLRGRDKRRIETGKINDRQQVVQALEKAGWNKSKAARLLGMHRVTLYKVMKKFGIKE